MTTNEILNQVNAFTAETPIQWFAQATTLFSTEGGTVRVAFVRTPNYESSVEFDAADHARFEIQRQGQPLPRKGSLRVVTTSETRTINGWLVTIYNVQSRSAR